MRSLRILLLVLFMTGIGQTGRAAEQAAVQSLLASVASLQEEGRLTEAEQQLEAFLAENSATLALEDQRALEYEIERGRRIRLDYTHTREDVVERVSSESRGVKNFQPAELDEWEKQGRIDYKVIDGTKMYRSSTLSSLFFRYPDLRERRQRVRESEWQPFLRDHVRDVVKETEERRSVFGAPRRFLVEFKVEVDAGVVSEGETVRCWMPFPQQFAPQENVRLLSAEPWPLRVNRADYPMRSLYFEKKAPAEGTTVFEAKWSLNVLPRRVEVDPDIADADAAYSDPAASYFLEEKEPHLAFTDDLRELETRIAGDETNPYRKARMYYDWMCDNVTYSYAREYSTLRNISQYVCENRYGDCGQLALMYMALCRIGGIPARWQSGWIIYPQDVNLHDWCEIYIEPAGWIPVDVNYGIFTKTTFDSLTPDEREEVRDFFFGGIDAYRMIVNRDHGFPHNPAKDSWRSDDVDFQRGEVEAGGKNIYFKDFSYDLNVTFLTD